MLTQLELLLHLCAMSATAVEAGASMAAAFTNSLCAGVSPSIIGAQTASPEGLYANGCNLYVYLADLPWFRAQVKALYLAHAEFFASLGADGGFLDAERETYAPVFARNYAEAGWSIKTWYVAGQKKPLATYEENFDYLKDWCARRCSYLDALFAAE